MSSQIISWIFVTVLAVGAVTTVPKFADSLPSKKKLLEEKENKMGDKSLLIQRVCPVCGGKYTSGSIGIQMSAHPSLKHQCRGFSSAPTSEVEALVCKNCGYCELYVRDLSKISPLSF
jgi:hypothetical protein